MPLVVHAKDQGRFVWAVLDFPPFEILSGEYQGSGSFDGLLTLLTERLKQYDHQVVPMSFARRDEEFKAGVDFCTPGIFRTPGRVKQGWQFSKPSLLHLDNRVIMLAAKAARLGEVGPIDIAKLFARRDLIGGVVQGRSYSPNIDEAIANVRDAPHILMRSIRADQYFQMLMSREVDYIILFPHEAAYFAKRFGAEDQIVNRPIAGTPPYIFTHVACTNGNWGKQAIKEIDAILDAERGKPAYRAFSERWYDEDDKLKIRQNYPEMLRTE